MRQETTETATQCTTADGAGLHVERWVASQPKALTIIVHGIVEHSGRYSEMAGALNRVGITVWAPDARGHGRSRPKKRGLSPRARAIVNGSNAEARIATKRAG